MPASFRLYCTTIAVCMSTGAFTGCDRPRLPLAPDRTALPSHSAITSAVDTLSAHINLNPGSRYQTITGWEAHPQSGQHSPDFHLYSDTLFDVVVNDLGINRVRLEVKSGAEHSYDQYARWRSGAISDSTWRCVRYSTVNDNSDPDLINWEGFHFTELDSIIQKVILPLQRRLAARGERLHVNLVYVAFTGQICPGLQYHHDDSPQEYAELILATTLYLKNRYDLTPDSWEVILEPDNTRFWRGRTIGNAILATATKLTAHGFTPRFITPSTGRSFYALPYFDEMIAAVPAVKPYLLELSYHRYSSPTVADLQAIASRAAEHDISTSMLEKIKADYHTLHSDLKHANVTSWQQYALAFGQLDDGSQYYTINRTDPSKPRVVIASRTKFLRQYFRFVRAGAVRIEAATTNPLVDPIAFINTNGTCVVVLKSASTARLPLTIQALPPGTYGVVWTNAAGATVQGQDLQIGAGQLVTTYIPARAVMTVYQK
jgi:hypothetical protein